MEEGVLQVNATWGTSCDLSAELEYMDGLLLQGCWLETNGSDFSFYDASVPISPIEPSLSWPTLEANYVLGGGISLNEKRQKSSIPRNLSDSPSQGPHFWGQSLENINNAIDFSCQPENYSIVGCEFNKRWWIPPQESSSVMDRLIKVLENIKERSKDKDILIQVWIPITSGGKRVLTTNHQPFALDLNCPRLANYRDVSVNFEFPADEDSRDSQEVVGLPGRVFRSKIPEWTPDVRFFTRDEYPRVGHAKKYDIGGSLAVPILDQGTRSCLGVIEVVLTTQKIKYRSEVESVCKALEAVHLKSSEISTSLGVKMCDLSYQAALPEVAEVLQSACATHGLPLAQTWVPCVLLGKGGCRHSDENLEKCLSPIDTACCIRDSSVQGFYEACSEYHLLKGQGIVGKAFVTNQPCFSPDVTSYSKTEYPLSHHARMFRLQAAVAIRLRSICTGSANFVLEFFLPANCSSPEEQKKMLNSLSTLIQNICRTLRVVTDRELQQETELPVKVANPPVLRFKEEVSTQEQAHFTTPYANQASHQSLFQNGNSREILAEPSEVRSNQPDSTFKDRITFDTNPCTSGDVRSIYPNKTGDKKRIKAEKTITLQVLRQHFAGSLKDSARNLGVCPTTLKRICRQHGILRWPSRKIKKVGHSLQKIKRVIDSVQGASGVLQIESFYSNFPELASQNTSRTGNSNFKSIDHRKPNGFHSGCSGLSPPVDASVSPSSCSPDSGSSQCCSNGTQPSSYTLSFAFHDESVAMGDYADCTPKRARSDVNLDLSNDEPRPFPRSQHHKSLHGTDACKILPPAVEGSWPKSQGRDGPRVKVIFGEEKIRFRMQSNWVYAKLLQEISRRFGIDDTNCYHLKYMDDDTEWVLLTCDADLDECFDVCRSSRNDTIKLLFVSDSQLSGTPHSSRSNHLG